MIEINELITPEAALTIAEVTEFCNANVSSVEITDNTQYEGAMELIKQIKIRAAELEKSFRSVKDPINAAGKEVDTKYNLPRALLNEKANVLSRGIVAYNNRIEQQRRIAQAEIDRKAAEARAKAEAEAKALRDKAALQAEQGKDRFAVANEIKADLIVAAAEAVVQEVAQIEEPPKVSGTTIKGTWKASEEVDIAALAKHCMDRGDCWNLLSANMVALNQSAKASAGQAKIGGVKFIFNQSVSLTGGRK